MGMEFCFFLSNDLGQMISATNKQKKHAMDTRVLSWIFFFEYFKLILLFLYLIHKILNVGLIYEAPACSGEVNNETNF